MSFNASEWLCAWFQKGQRPEKRRPNRDGDTISKARLVMKVLRKRGSILFTKKDRHGACLPFMTKRSVTVVASAAAALVYDTVAVFNTLLIIK